MSSCHKERGRKNKIIIIKITKKRKKGKGEVISNRRRIKNKHNNDKKK